MVGGQRELSGRGNYGGYREFTENPKDFEVKLDFGNLGERRGYSGQPMAGFREGRPYDDGGYRYILNLKLKNKLSLLFFNCL